MFPDFKDALSPVTIMSMSSLPRLQISEPPGPNPSLVVNDEAKPSISEALILLKHDQLQSKGHNFMVWERQLKVMIRTGLSYAYLDTSASTDIRSDQLALSMILWSIDERLQVDLRLESSAGEISQALKSRFSPSTRFSSRHLTASVENSPMSQR